MSIAISGYIHVRRDGHSTTSKERAAAAVQRRLRQRLATYGDGWTAKSSHTFTHHACGYDVYSYSFTFTPPAVAALYAYCAEPWKGI